MKAVEFMEMPKQLSGMVKWTGSYLVVAGMIKIVGNVGVTVYDGVINASMGASYGASSDHTVTGNSNNIVYGGDFSGTPREGTNGFLAE